MKSPCYNPEAFNPDGQALLEKSSWIQIQMYLNDALTLPLTKDKFPEERVLPIFNALHNAAQTYKNETLPKARTTAQSLADFGDTVRSSFDAIVNLLAVPNPDDATKKNVQGLFQYLVDSATDQGTAAAQLASETKAFADSLEAQANPLADFLKAEIDKEADLKLKLQPLLQDVDAQRIIIKDAQNKILADKKTIDDTKYYSWIPIIGTIVAVAEIVTSENDMKAQIEKIKQATNQVLADNEQLNQLNGTIGQLKYAADFASSQKDFLTNVLPNIAKIEGAWGTINLELNSVLKHVNEAEADELKGVMCLAETALTTAINQWDRVVNDAHSFMENFYIVDARQAVARASVA